MKKYFLLIALCTTGLSLFSQTIDEIYSKYVTAAGGPAAEKIKTMKMTAQLTVQGMELPMTQQIIAGRGVKTEVAVMGTEVQMAYLDGKGWKINQFAGFPDATAMDAGELAGQREQTSVISPLFDSKKNGDKLELAGQETLPEGKAWKIRATSKDGQLTDFYVNATTFDIVKSVGKRNVNGVEVEVEAIYSGYQVVEGVRLPFELSNKVGGQVGQQIKVEKYELNVPVDEKIFAMPG